MTTRFVSRIWMPLLALLAVATGAARAGTTLAPASADPVGLTLMYEADYLAPFALPAAINRSGDVVGRNPVWNEAFVVPAKGDYRALPCPPGLTACQATDINDLGWIVGWGERAPFWTPQRTALLWRPSGDSYSVTRLAGSALPGAGKAAGIPTAPPAEAVAINAANEVLIRFPGAASGDGLVQLWTPKGSFAVKTPGEVVDLSDSGWIAGNADRPYRLHAKSGQLLWTEIPFGYVGASAVSINSHGEMAGSLFDARGRSLMATAGSDGFWQSIGGVGPTDFAVTITDLGEVVGHAHGLRPGSHCAIRLADLPLVALEDLFAGSATGWVIGHDVGGMNEKRVIATEATHGVTGIPALVRLVPVGTVRECGGECMTSAAIEIDEWTSPNDPTFTRYSATVELATDDPWEPPTIVVEVTWILDDGRRVVRQKAESDVDGRVRFTVDATAAPVELYVTGLSAPGRRFDPTRGVLRSGR
jgi:hypothetical protein